MIARQAQVDDYLRRRQFLPVLERCAPGFQAFPAGSDNPPFFNLTHMICAGSPGTTKGQQFRCNGSSR